MNIESLYLYQKKHQMGTLTETEKLQSQDKVQWHLKYVLWNPDDPDLKEKQDKFDEQILKVMNGEEPDGDYVMTKEQL